MKLFSMNILLTVTMLSVLAFSSMAVSYAASGSGTLFGIDTAGNFLEIDNSTGAITSSTSMNFSPISIVLPSSSLAVDPSTGIVYFGSGLGGSTLYTFDPVSDTTAFLGNPLLGPPPSPSFFGGMDFNSTGTMYVSYEEGLPFTGIDADTLATIDVSTLSRVDIGTFTNSTTTITGMEAIAFDPSGVLYGATTGNGTDGQPTLYTINSGNAAVTLVSPILDSVTANPPNGGITSMQFDCTGTLFAGTGAGNLVEINPTNGISTVIGNTISAGTSLGGLAFSSVCSTSSGPPTPTPGGQGNNDGDGCDGCTPPTLGVNKDGRRFVEGGFTYNGKTVDVENFYTPYNLTTTNVGKDNTAVFKIFDNLGPDHIRHFAVAFGLEKGQIISEGKTVIEWDRSFDGVESMNIIDQQNILSNVTINTTTGDCNENEDEESPIRCLIVTIDHVFREPLEGNMIATNVWDDQRNAWQNYFNDGIEIIGKSLNPPKTEFVASGQKGVGLVHITQVDKRNEIWVDEKGYQWTKNKFDTWFQITKPEFQRHSDEMSTVITRHNSNFAALVDYEIDRAKAVFDGATLQKEIAESFAHTFPDIIQNKLDDPQIQNRMLLEESSAIQTLKKMLE